MARRLATIRRGIAYQDLVAADALIGMVLDDAAAPSWVKLEHRIGGTFDDVVVGFPTGVVWKQIKWAANPGAEPLTIDGLSTVDSRRGKPLIVGFADSYRTITGLGEPFRLEFVTNRSPDPEFRKLLTGGPSGLKLPLPTRTRARLDVAWRKPTGMSRDEFQKFRLFREIGGIA